MIGCEFGQHNGVQVKFLQERADQTFESALKRKMVNQWLPMADHFIRFHATAWNGDTEMFDFNFSNIFLMFWKSFAIFLSWTLWSHAAGGYWKNNLCHNWAQAWGADQRKCQPTCVWVRACSGVQTVCACEGESGCITERERVREKEECVSYRTHVLVRRPACEQRMGLGRRSIKMAETFHPRYF